jgi:hypothetical protein
VYQRGFVKTAVSRGFADGLMLGASQPDTHNVRALEHWFDYFVELVLEVGYIMVLPEGRQFLDGVGCWESRHQRLFHAA